MNAGVDAAHADFNWRHLTFAFGITAASTTYSLEAARLARQFNTSAVARHWQVALFGCGTCFGTLWLLLLLSRSRLYRRHQRCCFNLCLALTSAYSCAFFWLPLVEKPASRMFYLQRMWAFPVLTTLAGRGLEHMWPVLLGLVVPVHLSLDTAWQYKLCQSQGSQASASGSSAGSPPCNDPPQLLQLLLLRMLPSVLGLLCTLLVVSLFAEDSREEVVSQGATAQRALQTEHAEPGSSAADTDEAKEGSRGTMWRWRGRLQRCARYLRLSISRFRHLKSQWQNVPENLAKIVSWPLGAAILCMQLIRITMGASSSPGEVLLALLVGIALGHFEGKDISQVWFDQLTAMTALAHDLVPSHVAQQLVQQMTASWQPQQRRRLRSHATSFSGALARSPSHSCSAHSPFQAEAGCFLPSRLPSLTPSMTSSSGSSPATSHRLLGHHQRPELRQDALEAVCDPDDDAAHLVPPPPIDYFGAECDDEMRQSGGSAAAVMSMTRASSAVWVHMEDETMPPPQYTPPRQRRCPVHSASATQLQLASPAPGVLPPAFVGPAAGMCLNPGVRCHDALGFQREQLRRSTTDGLHGAAASQLHSHRPLAVGSGTCVPGPDAGQRGQARASGSQRPARSLLSISGSSCSRSWLPTILSQGDRQPRDGATEEGWGEEYGLACASQATSNPPKLLAFSHGAVTVLFADIVGFTTLSKALEPYQVFEFLNELYARYDAVVDRFRVYKVETIGDCYMCATGLLSEDPEHAAQMLRFAREMQLQAAQVQMPDGTGPVRVRVGIHSGPLLSGVIGRIRKRYCVVGSTVNLASRMESTGVPGRVHISEDTHGLVRHLPEFEWECRGDIEVKGVGLMVTYMLKQAA